MRKLVFVLAVLSFAVSAKAQTVVLSNNFTFAAGSPCSAVTYDTGGIGTICLNQGDTYGGYGSFLDVPFQLGYLNNGYLSCDPLVWQPKLWSIGDGTHNGDVFSVAGITTCPYYTGEYGTDFNSNNRLEGFSVIANYTVVEHRSCYRGRCINYFTNVLQGGTGTVTDSTIN